MVRISDSGHWDLADVFLEPPKGVAHVSLPYWAGPVGGREQDF